jgi:hypothetical protein
MKGVTAMDKNEIVAYCGIYCGLCGANARIPQTARQLRDYLEHGAYEDRERGNESFSVFWVYLQELANNSEIKTCRRDACGPNVGGIKKCARRRDIEFCFDCDDYPCDKVQMLAKSSPTLIHDGERVKSIGLDQWIEEQEGRREKGFCYYEIHCPCEEFPLDFT